MASNAKQTKFRRKLRRAKMGAERKRVAAAKGSTPKFPVHTAASEANAPAAELCANS